jgi:predicted transcriptional regulator
MQTATLPTLADIRQAIVSRRADIPYKEIASECGVSIAFIKDLARGVAVNPSYPNTVKVYEYVIGVQR